LPLKIGGSDQIRLPGISGNVEDESLAMRKIGDFFPLISPDIYTGQVFQVAKVGKRFNLILFQIEIRQLR